MRKKVVSSLLVTALALTTLTGCGTKTATDYQKIMAGDVSGEITVSCYDSTTYKSYLEQGAKLFEEKYPGTKVNVESVGALPQVKTQQDGGKTLAVVTAGGNDQQGKDDYVSRVNTEIMSGGGADILALDVLPYYKYADNGQLEDLNNFIQNDPGYNKAAYTENVLAATAYKGGQYIFPMDYTFNYFAYDSSLMADFPAQDKLTYQDVIKAAKDGSASTGNKIFGQSAYSVQKGSSFFEKAYSLDYTTFVDIINKKVDFTGGEFAELLETVKSYADNGSINPANVTAAEMSRETSLDKFAADNAEKYYAKFNSSLNLVNQFTRNLGTKTNVIRQAGSSGSSEHDEIAGLVANDQGKVDFSYTQGYGLNSNSKNKRTAWEFIKFLASEEMQSSGLGSPNSIPINNQAKEKTASMLITGEAIQNRAAAMGVSGGPAGKGQEAAKELTPEQQQALANYLATLDRFTKLLNNYDLHDAKIDNMVTTEVKNFFTGEKTAAEVAKALQSKVELYLNE